MIVRRRISPVDSFVRSMDSLSCATSRRIVDALLKAAADRPESALELDGSNVRVIHTRPYGPYPGLSLYYRYDEKAVYPLHIEPCDPLVVVSPFRPSDA